MDAEQRAVAGTAGPRPWAELSRFGAAWRAALACATVAMAGVLLMHAAVLLDPTRPPLVGGSVAWLIGLALPVLCGLLALPLFGWLRRFRPVAQGALFGAIATVVVFACVSVWVVSASSAEPCRPGTGCWGTGAVIVFLAVFYAVPVFLLTGIGYALAVAVSGRPGAHRPALVVFWVVLALFVLVFGLQAIIG